MEEHVAVERVKITRSPARTSRQDDRGSKSRLPFLVAMRIVLVDTESTVPSSADAAHHTSQLLLVLRSTNVFETHVPVEDANRAPSPFTTS